MGAHASGRGRRRASTTGNRARGPRRVVGFTLIETALATVIIGVGVVAMVESQQAFIRSNLWSSHAAAGLLLANEVRARMANLPKHDPVSGLTLSEGSGGSPELHGWGPESNETELWQFDDIDDFDGITFHWAGTEGHGDGDLPGPINAFGEVVQGIAPDGSVEEIPARGWAQTVRVEKIGAFDTGTTLRPGDRELPSGSRPGRAVDEYPLRVTVEVTYEDPATAQTELVARLVWVVP